MRSYCSRNKPKSNFECAAIAVGINLKAILKCAAIAAGINLKPDLGRTDKVQELITITSYPKPQCGLKLF